MTDRTEAGRPEFTVEEAMKQILDIGEREGNLAAELSNMGPGGRVDFVRALAGTVLERQYGPGATEATAISGLVRLASHVDRSDPASGRPTSYLAGIFQDQMLEGGKQ